MSFTLVVIVLEAMNIAPDLNKLATQHTIGEGM